MFYTLPYKTKQFFFVLIKLSIVIGAFYFIYNKLTQNQNLSFNEFYHFLEEKDTFSLKNITFLLFLTGFNWFFEIAKWKILVQTIQQISFKQSLEQSLGALTASLFTPNRIGEYGAKAVYFNFNLRKKIMLLNLIGNMMQMGTTLIFGCIGFTYFLIHYPLDINYYKIARLLLLVLVIFTLIGLGNNYKKLRIKGFSVEKLKTFIKNLPLKTKLLGFSLSITRYLIFSFQFYFLLTLFDVELDYFSAMTGITSMYLLASVMPSVFIFDMIIKGSVAVFLFQFLNVNEITMLAVTTTMWLLNFAIPSLFGSYYVLNFNFSKDD